MDSRIKWIDAAKGLGIVLVVMSHAPIDETLKAFLFAFHMPLFFYLSGAVFRPHSMSIWAFIKKKHEACYGHTSFFQLPLISFGTA